MKIVLATPLYPPDIAEPGTSTKELARRLSATDTVVIVTYGRFTEPVAGVRIVAVDKRAWLPVRLVRYLVALMKELRSTDVVYAENGPSVELPVLLASAITRTPLVLHMGDQAAAVRAAAHPFLRTIERAARGRAREVIDESAPERPEIIPFFPFPTSEMQTYDDAWTQYVAHVTRSLRHA